VANHVIAITNPNGAITLKKGCPTQSQNFFPPQNIMLLCPTMLMPITKTRQRQNFKKKKRLDK
jgi:hypothetical protein